MCVCFDGGRERFASTLSISLPFIFRMEIAMGTTHHKMTNWKIVLF